MDSSQDNNEEELRAATLRNAKETLTARQQADQELLETRDALELKTRQLAHSLELLRTTLESTSDGILVTDSSGTITDFNEQYITMWRLPRALVEGRNHRRMLEAMTDQYVDADGALKRIESIYVLAPPESFDVLELTDGRVFERLSKLQLLANQNAGRVWSFRDITHRINIERALREETHALEVLNKTGAALALTSRLDMQSILKTVVAAGTELTRAQFGTFQFNNEAVQSHLFRLLHTESVEAFPLPHAEKLFALTLGGAGVVRINDVLTDARYNNSVSAGKVSSDHLAVRSYLAIPVISREGMVQGGLFFAHMRPNAFTLRDEKMGNGIATQAAIAIDNALLFAASEHTHAQLQESNTTLEAHVAEHTAALIDSERHFKLLVASVVDYGIYMLDPGGTVISWNPGAEHIKGYTETEIIGRHFSVFYTDKDRADNLPQKVLAIAERSGKYEAEAWRVRKDGSRFWASIVIDAIRDEKKRLVGFVKITRDMTERRAIQEQLHQSQKMEAIGQLTGGVAHDFNNLLTVILGNLETLTRHLPVEAERLRNAAAQATRGAQRAATLTQQLLAFSRRQPLNPKPTNINDLVIGVTDLMRRTLRESIVIETVLDAAAWHVEIDAHQLESALLNLVVNSRDAMPDGGKIIIETINADLTENNAAPGTEIKPGQYVMLCVHDNGIGMSSDVMAKAFNPFFTTKPLGEGTGLGLSQVYGFINQSGGHIKLHSEEGQGTTVKIYLPRRLGEYIEIESEPAISMPRGNLNEIILVVEDDDDVRACSTDSLRELGFTVLEAANADSALRILDRHPEVQLVFTDVGLPGLNGRELIDIVLKKWPLMKVLFTSGYAQSAIVHDDRLDPGIELLTKPFTRAQLATRIRGVLDARKETPDKPKTVLIVEDEPLIRMFLADMLADMRFTVIETGSAAEALKVATLHGSVDLAIVDLNLPDQNGIELMQELRHIWPQLMVIMASGYGDQSAQLLRSDPRATFIGKPYNSDEVRAALQKIGMQLQSAG